MAGAISYKILTLFVRFMLWESRKMKKIAKTAVSLLNAAQKQTQIEKHMPNSELQYKFKHWGYINIPNKMLTLLSFFVL